MTVSTLPFEQYNTEKVRVTVRAKVISSEP